MGLFQMIKKLLLVALTLSLASFTLSAAHVAAPTQEVPAAAEGQQPAVAPLLTAQEAAPVVGAPIVPEAQAAAQAEPAPPVNPPANPAATGSAPVAPEARPAEPQPAATEVPAAQPAAPQQDNPGSWGRYFYSFVAGTSNSATPTAPQAAAQAPVVIQKPHELLGLNIEQVKAMTDTQWTAHLGRIGQAESVAGAASGVISIADLCKIFRDKKLRMIYKSGSTTPSLKRMLFLQKLQELLTRPVPTVSAARQNAQQAGETGAIAVGNAAQAPALDEAGVSINPAPPIEQAAHDAMHHEDLPATTASLVAPDTTGLFLDDVLPEAPQPGSAAASQAPVITPEERTALLENYGRVMSALGTYLDKFEPAVFTSGDRHLTPEELLNLPKKLRDVPQFAACTRHNILRAVQDQSNPQLRALLNEKGHEATVPLLHAAAYHNRRDAEGIYWSQLWNTTRTWTSDKYNRGTQLVSDHPYMTAAVVTTAVLATAGGIAYRTAQQALYKKHCALIASLPIDLDLKVELLEERKKLRYWLPGFGLFKSGSQLFEEKFLAPLRTTSHLA